MSKEKEECYYHIAHMRVNGGVGIFLTSIICNRSELQSQWKKFYPMLNLHYSSTRFDKLSEERIGPENYK